MNLERYSGGSDRAFWLEAWDGNSFIVERLGRPPVMLPHLLVGVVGGFQPDLLARSFAGDSRRHLYPLPLCVAARGAIPRADRRCRRGRSRDHQRLRPAGEPAGRRRRGVRTAQRSTDGGCQTGICAIRAICAPGKAIAGRARPRILVQGYGACAAPVRHAVFPRMGLERRCRAAGDRGAPCRGRGDCCGRATCGRTGAPHCAWWGLPTSTAMPARCCAGLHAGNKTTVSREEVRREALAQRLDAGETQALLDMLVRAGWLREVPVKVSGPGRPPRRWEVNPRLFEVPL